MFSVDQTGVRNQLLKALSSNSYSALSPLLERIDIPKGTVLIEAGTEPAYCIFYEEGLGSVLSQNSAGQTVEIGLFGSEGFSGISVVLQSGEAPHRLVMQIGGSGYRVPTPAFAALLRSEAALARLMQRYVMFFLGQVGQTCLSNALHSIEMRLARWLLMSLDRMPDNHVPLTQEYLSLMLGCNRTTVTGALGAFADKGMIRSGRGSIEILDRDALEGAAGEAYGGPEREYDRLIAPFFMGTTQRQAELMG